LQGELALLNPKIDQYSRDLESYKEAQSKISGFIQTPYGWLRLSNNGKDFFKATMNYSDATKALVTEKTLEFEIRLKSSTAIYKEALRLKIPSDDLMILVSTSIKFDIPIETIDKLYKNIKSQNLPYNENAARLTSVIAEKHQTKFKAGSSISQTEFSKTINLYREILYSLYLRADLERYPEIAPQLLQICLKFNLTSDVLLYTFILRYKLYNSDFSYTFPQLISIFLEFKPTKFEFLRESFQRLHHNDVMPISNAASALYLSHKHNINIAAITSDFSTLMLSEKNKNKNNTITFLAIKYETTFSDDQILDLYQRILDDPSIKKEDAIHILANSLGVFTLPF
jgi:hypothetical protein